MSVSWWYQWARWEAAKCHNIKLGVDGWISHLCWQQHSTIQRLCVFTPFFAYAHLRIFAPIFDFVAVVNSFVCLVVGWFTRLFGRWLLTVVDPLALLPRPTDSLFRHIFSLLLLSDESGNRDVAGANTTKCSEWDVGKEFLLLSVQKTVNADRMGLYMNARWS